MAANGIQYLAESESGCGVGGSGLGLGSGFAISGLANVLGLAICWPRQPSTFHRSDA